MELISAEGKERIKSVYRDVCMNVRSSFIDQ